MAVRVVGFALALGFAPAVLSQGAYEIDAAGTVWRTGYGKCWRTSQWTPAQATAACDPELVPNLAGMSVYVVKEKDKEPPAVASFSQRVRTIFGDTTTGCFRWQHSRLACSRRCPSSQRAE